MVKGGFVYILANKRNGTLYIGVTSDLDVRMQEHKNKIYPNSFTARYNINMLVYYKFYDNIETAIKWEKKIKDWNRDWKIELIIKDNSNWNDLYVKAHI